MEEEEAAEEAEEVGGEQRQVDRRGAGHLHHHGHEAVERVHAQGVERKQHDCGAQTTRSVNTGQTRIRLKSIQNKIRIHI